MGLAKFRAAGPRPACPNGSVAYVTLSQWMSGPSLAQINHCPVKLDGQDHPARTAYLQGEADTYFSIPAAICVKGKRVSGFVMFETGRGFMFYNDRPAGGRESSLADWLLTGDMFDEAGKVTSRGDQDA